MRYDAASNSRTPAGECQPGAVALRTVSLWWDDTFRDLGCYVDRQISGGHTNSLHRDGRAIDIGVDTYSPMSKAAMDVYCDALVEHHELLRVQQIIWYRRIWTVGIGWRDFDGSSGPHTDHAHIEINKEGAANLDLFTALSVLLPEKMEDEEMTPEDYQGIAKAIIEYPIETTYDVDTDSQRQVQSNVGAILANIGIQLDRLVRDARES